MDDHGYYRWECETCTRVFSSVHASAQHMNALGHWKHYCSPCQRRFGSDNELRMHLNSRTHRGANVPCPFCNRGFTSASGLSHHLESGGCPHGRAVNRQTIYNTLRQRDPNGIITNNLLEWHGETWSTTNAWNGSDYECYLCHHRFQGMRGLDAHLKSPRHMQEIYHCPNSGCRTQFKSLAGMFNHLESESCGFMKFGGVQERVGGVIAGRQRLIEFE